MVIIYSSEVIEGINGAYIEPHYFNENALEKANLVYAKDSKILEAYKNKGIEVIELNPKKTTKK